MPLKKNSRPPPSQNSWIRPCFGIRLSFHSLRSTLGWNDAKSVGSHCGTKYCEEQVKQKLVKPHVCIFH